MGTEDFVSRAKKGTIEILKALRAYRCHSCSVFFLIFFFCIKLFDAKTVPSLLYAAEIWGYRENEQIERVHLYECKLFIDVPTVTPNDMIYGELGEVPNIHRSCCKMYAILVSCATATCYTAPKDGLPIATNSPWERTWKWVTHVKSILCKCDYGFVCLFGGVGDEKLFLRDLKKTKKNKKA